MSPPPQPSKAQVAAADDLTALCHLIHACDAGIGAWAEGAPSVLHVAGTLAQNGFTDGLPTDAPPASVMLGRAAGGGAGTPPPPPCPAQTPAAYAPVTMPPPPPPQESVRLRPLSIPK
eukprot:Rhum_TRINITY_DN4270_c0_g1::Rhum_TRINITY_DN4270_c0_g1_i1::g.13627::m.13627